MLHLLTFPLSRRWSTLKKIMGFTLFSVGASQAGAQVLNIYGAGDSSPPYKEAAAQFEQQTGCKTHFVVGPAPAWIDAAKKDADFIFGGSESMLSQLAMPLGEQLRLSDVHSLYLRKTIILVRPGNPKHILGFRSLGQLNVNVQIGNSPGIFGVWEDMAGQSPDIRTLRALRSHVVNFAPTSMDGIKFWTEHPEVDAWVIWNVFHVTNPELGDALAIETPYATYRDTAAVITLRGHANPAAEKFLAFLESPSGAQIFASKGWLTENSIEVQK